MGNCKDCRFWDRSWQDKNTKLASCDAFDYLDNGARPAEDGAAFDLRVSDDYGLRHEFKTGPMFGCVKFQAREKK